MRKQNRRRGAEEQSRETASHVTPAFAASFSASSRRHSASLLPPSFPAHSSAARLPVARRCRLSPALDVAFPSSPVCPHQHAIAERLAIDVYQAEKRARRRDEKEAE